MDSIHVDYESDDTTYSNVFNLEGEESCKPNTNRKKKKPKKENHLFFEDVNQEWERLILRIADVFNTLNLVSFKSF